MKRQALLTLGYIAASLVLVLAAAWTSPESRKAAIFSDQGDTLFPAFRDAMAVKAIEVIDFSAEDAVARPLKAEFRKGKWILPSHYDYPSDARERLAKTAGSLLDLKKDITVSDRMEDHARYGVIDPLDTKVTSLTGRGKRVTLRDEAGGLLCDVILGEPVKERQGYRYLRIPGQKRVYAVKTDADPSAKFEDWIDPSILRISPAQIRAVTVLAYSISESMGALTNADRVSLRKNGDQWTMDGGGTPKAAAVQSLLNGLANLKLVGARPKPPELAAQLRARGPLQMTLESMMSLRQRGYFISPDGRLLANEGETMVETENGVLYNLRFGEIVSGQGDGKPEAKDPAKAADENRFLFLSASWDANRAAKYGASGGNGEAVADALRNKFADWYYVISGADFNRLRPKREALTN